MSPGETLYYCRACNRSYQSEEALLRHMDQSQNRFEYFSSSKFERSNQESVNKDNPIITLKEELNEAFSLSDAIFDGGTNHKSDFVTAPSKPGNDSRGFLPKTFKFVSHCDLKNPSRIIHSP